MNVKLRIRENATFKGYVEVDGMELQLWVYTALNEMISYYIRDDNLAPVKIQLQSGTHLDTIRFVQFKAIVPERSVFEVKSSLHCDAMKIEGIKNPTREEIKNYFNVVPVLLHTKPTGLKLRERSSIDPATLALIGKTLWAIIKENKAEANLENNLNAVIPNGTSWTDMSGWRQQKWPGWQWTLVNPYGVNVVDYKWSFNFLCGGQYKSIGRYIQNAGAFPTSIDVLWGYKVNVRGQVLNPFNYGTTTSPVAGLTLSMTMDSETLIKKITQTCTVNLIGDCSTEVVSCNGYKVSTKFEYF